MFDRHAAGPVSSIRPSSATPAECTNTSRPSIATAASATASASARSTGHGAASGNCAARSSSAPEFRPPNSNRCVGASSSAIAAPMPRLAPVINASGASAIPSPYVTHSGVMRRHVTPHRRMTRVHRMTPVLREVWLLDVLAGDEPFHGIVGLRIAVLLRRRLHEVRRRGQDRATDVAVSCDLRSAEGVDDDTRRVRRVPYFELVLHI